jgi:hypothetical protein
LSEYLFIVWVFRFWRCWSWWSIYARDKVRSALDEMYPRDADGGSGAATTDVTFKGFKGLEFAGYDEWLHRTVGVKRQAFAVIRKASQLADGKPLDLVRADTIARPSRGFRFWSA